jgi:hypothetical protein
MEHDFSSGTNGKVAVGATSTTVLTANDGRKYCALVNDSDEAIYVSLGTAAVMNQGIRLNANGGSLEIAGERPYRGAIYAICTSGSKNLAYFYA